MTEKMQQAFSEQNDLLREQNGTLLDQNELLREQNKTLLDQNELITRQNDILLKNTLATAAGAIFGLVAIFIACVALVK